MVSLLLILSCGTLQANPLNEIRADAQNVRIRVQALPLGEVLDQVTAKSGVRFIVPQSLIVRSVTANIKTKDWKEAVQDLLTDFSRVEMWDEDLKKSRIQLIAVGQPQPSSRSSSLAPVRQRRQVEPVLKTVEIKPPPTPKPAWRCFSLTSKKKC